MRPTISLLFHLFLSVLAVEYFDYPEQYNAGDQMEDYVTTVQPIQYSRENTPDQETESEGRESRNYMDYTQV